LAAVAIASSALATTAVWLDDGQTATSKVSVVSSNLGAFKVEDMGTSAAAVECASQTVDGEGWAGPGSEDEITQVTFVESAKNCKPTAKALNLKNEEVTNACEKVEEVSAVDLPG
jgi:hypothetical protein